jgi:uncharacterized protein (TIGR02145 family)
MGGKIKISGLILLILLLLLDHSCKKSDDNSVKDSDGNTYQTVTIGTQVWFVEDLRVTHYHTGDPIPNVTDGTVWSNLTSGAYCDYDNAQSNSIIYGRLYNWYAVRDNRNICPIGYHVPTTDEWLILINYLGGIAVAGEKLREQGTDHWNDAFATSVYNESGFTALPVGTRGNNGVFSGRGDRVGWWTSTKYDSNAGTWVMNHYQIVESSWNQKCGVPVRCLKDN